MLRFPYDVKNFYTINFTMPPIMCKFVQSGIGSTRCSLQIAPIDRQYFNTIHKRWKL